MLEPNHPSLLALTRTSTTFSPSLQTSERQAAGTVSSKQIGVPIEIRSPSRPAKTSGDGSSPAARSKLMPRAPRSSSWRSSQGHAEM